MRDTRSRSLQRRTDNQDRTPNHDHLPSSESVSEEEGKERAEETSDFVDGDDGSLKRRRAGSGRGGIDFGEFLSECSAREQAGHDALIITEEQECRATAEKSLVSSVRPNMFLTKTYQRVIPQFTVRPRNMATCLFEVLVEGV
jgi:hypothetical protein